MIGGRRVLALVPARGGSKGLPGKNLLPVGGKPLLAWTADAARAARHLDRIVLSSDSADIRAAGAALGLEVPFTRPPELATDTATTLDVALHALDALPGHDLLVLLQPTSPLRTAADIEATLERLVNSGAPACVSVAEADQSPYWMYNVGDGEALTPLLPPHVASRRQDLPPVVVLNGAVYAVEVAVLREKRSFVPPGTVAHRMPAQRSLDLDTLQDLQQLEALLASR